MCHTRYVVYKDRESLYSRGSAIPGSCSTLLIYVMRVEGLLHVSVYQYDTAVPFNTVKTHNATESSRYLHPTIRQQEGSNLVQIFFIVPSFAFFPFDILLPGIFLTGNCVWLSDLWTSHFSNLVRLALHGQLILLCLRCISLFRRFRSPRLSLSTQK